MSAIDEAVVVVIEPDSVDADLAVNSRVSALLCAREMDTSN